MLLIVSFRNRIKPNKFTIEAINKWYYNQIRPSFMERRPIHKKIDGIVGYYFTNKINY